jgi:asparagine synthase (glutamine-hydrolysing)
VRDTGPDWLFRHRAGPDAAGRSFPCDDGPHAVAGQASRCVDGVTLWHGAGAEVRVGQPRRQAPHAASGAGSEPVTAADIARLWLSEGPAGLGRLTSAFALVIFDRVERTTHLAVDPLGLASLFWQVIDGGLWAGTEQAPLVAARPAPALDPLALPDVFNLRFLSGSRSLWHGLKQVVPGTLVTVAGEDVRVTPLRSIVFEPREAPASVTGLAAETLARLAACFGQQHDEGVREVGVLLSGGIDSTIMAALAAKAFPRCTAYTARVDGFSNPELPRAAEVARRLGLEHRIVDVSQDDLGRLFPVVVARLQEPPRHFNNLVLARLFEALSGHVAVVVAGDAADVLFGGGELGTLQRLAGKRRLAGLLPHSVQDRAGRWLSRSTHRRVRSLGRVLRFDMDRLIQRFDVIPRSRRADELLRPVVSGHGPSDELVAERFRRGPGDFETFQHWHLSTFLTSIFRRNHRLSSPNGLRMWYPLLEPAILDLATAMPTALKIDAKTGASKPVLREICGTLAGHDVALWSKMGFPSPERELMDGPLKAEVAACTGGTSFAAPWPDPERLAALDTSTDHQTLWTLLTLEQVWKQRMVRV